MLRTHSVDPPRVLRLRRIILIAIALGGCTLFVVVNGPTVTTVVRGLSDIAPRPAIAGVIFSLAAIFNRGLLNRAAHESMGLGIAPLAMTRTTAVGFGANKVVKSAGVSGLAVFLRSGRRRGFEGPKVVAACVLTAVAAYLALGVLLVATLVLLALTGDLTGWWIAAGVAFGAYTAAAVTVALAAWRSRNVARRLARRGLRIRDRLRRRSGTGPTDDLIDELYDSLALIGSEGHAVRRVLTHAVLSKALGVLMLMSAATAVGFPLGPKTAMVIYAATLGASLVAFLPGGIGVVEASATALLIAGGAAASVAVLAVALYRVLDVWLPVAVGLLLGRSELRTAAAAPTVVLEPIPAVAYV